MDKRIVTILQLILCSSAGAQTLTEDCNLPVINDSLSEQQVEFIGLSQRGRDVVWNIENADVVSNNYKVRYLDMSDCQHQERMIGIERGARQYVDHEGDTLFNGGKENHMTRMEYDLREVFCIFPVQYGDSLSGAFSGRGSYCDKQLLREYGLYKTVADGLGCLVMPSGDTLFHVLRLTTERLISIQILTRRDSQQQEYYGWEGLPVYNADSVMSHLQSDSVLLCTVHRRWYAAGYRYPILESIQTSRIERFFDDAPTPLSERMLYYPPALQEEQLRDDYNNQAIRNMIARGEYVSEGYNTHGNGTESPIIHYTFTQDQETQRVTINYNLNATATVKAVLSDAMGIIYQSVEQTNAIGNDYSLTLNYSGLRHGQYVLSIISCGITQTEKFVVK